MHEARPESKNWSRIQAPRVTRALPMKVTLLLHVKGTGVLINMVL